MASDLVRRAARLARSLSDPRGLLRIQRVRLPAFLAERRCRSRYRVLDEEALLRTRRSDRVFLFGGGSSLNAITPSAWEHIARHDTVGFSYFMRQHFVRADYHVVGEIATGNDTDRARWVPAIAEYADLITGNPLYAETVLLFQAGYLAYQSNRLAACGRLRPGTRVYRYRRISRGGYRPPSRLLQEGLVHGAGTLVGCVNFAFAMGWREIVIAGVDLYDSRYFWLPDDQPRPDMVEFRGITQEQPHPVAEALVPYLGGWREWLEREGVRLSVYNRHSLLAHVMPVYQR